MAAERLSMRKIREVLRLKHACGASERVIARSLGIGRTAIGEYIRRAAVIGITWPIPDDVDDTALERKLFAPAGYNPPRSKPLPEWGHVHAELRRRGVTLALLWEEYRGLHPDGYGYSRFCNLYVEWRHGITATMRQTHAAGEKLFVDFAGDTVPVFDGLTGEVRAAKIFVAVLGASNYTFAEARLSEALPDWIGAHVNALAFLGGVPKALVCDNLKAGVTVASRYEPGVNRTYQDLAAHYGTTVMPTRPRKPRDKAKVEAAVLIVERWILARLRNRRFFSLAELNVAIRSLVDELNARLMRLAHSRSRRRHSSRHALSRRAAVGHQPHQAAGPADPQPDRPAPDRGAGLQIPPPSSAVDAGRVSGAGSARFLRERARLHGRLRLEELPHCAVAQSDREGLRPEQFDPRQLPCPRELRDQ